MGCFLTGFLILTGIFILLGSVTLFIYKLYAYGVFLCVLALVIFYLAYKIRVKFKNLDYSYLAREGIPISFLHIEKNSYQDNFDIKYIDGPQVGKETVYASNTIKSSTFILFAGIHVADVTYRIPYKEMHGPMMTKILCEETIKFEAKENMYYVLSYNVQNNKFDFDEKPNTEEHQKLLAELKLK